MAEEYLQLAIAAVNNVERFTSRTNVSSVQFNKLQCQLLSQLLVESVKDVRVKMHHGRMAKHLELLKEFYRIVNDATNLLHWCCENSWFNVAMILVDGTEAFALRYAELIWCTNVILGSGKYPAIPVEQTEEPGWKARLESAARQDQAMLRSRLEKFLAADSRSDPESRKLARVLLQRLHGSEDAIGDDADKNPTYPDLRELRYELRRGELLGKGSFGTVFKTTWMGSNYALKEFNWLEVQLFAKEATVAAKLHHPNVVSLIGCFVEGHFCSLLMELMSKNLYEYLKESRRGWLSISKVRLSLPIALDIMLQIAEGMRYLHQKNVAHRDLKPHNILVSPVSDTKLARDGYVIVKLADFGSAKPNVESSTLMDTVAGTLLYRAPEIGRAEAAKPGDEYSRRADVYSFAMICCEVLTGEPPFPPEALPGLRGNLLQGVRPQFRHGVCPQYFSALIERCWDGDAGKRPAFRDICVELRRIKCSVLTGRYEDVSMERSLKNGPYDSADSSTSEGLQRTAVATLWGGGGSDNDAGPQLKGAKSFSFSKLKKATNNFNENNEIDVGACDKVYRGTLASGELVAVKRAQELQGLPEFKKEIELLSRVPHKNLVGLVGYCYDRKEQLLVYEFMVNGTMREWLVGKMAYPLDWSMRLAIAVGSARGLAHLHEHANPPIIHRDIKSSNILLDENLVAKVVDFGLSELAPDGADKLDLTTQVKGTKGYADPEYPKTGQLSEKCDVYSFGVVLLELLTGRAPIEHGKYVVREVRTALDKGGIAALRPQLDPLLRDAPPEDLEKFVDLALDCVEEKGIDRPTMNQVVQRLEVLPRHNNPASEGNGIGVNTHIPVDVYGDQELLERGRGESFQYSRRHTPTNPEPK